MKQNAIAKAISLALGGTLLSTIMLPSAEAHVMYNTYTASGTDGWTRADGSGNSGAPVPWLGTTGGIRPFGYEGKQALNWAVKIHTNSESHEVSQAHALSAYGATVDLDSSDGAWGSWTVGGLASGDTQGWAHNTDYGLLMSDVDTTITIDPMSLGPNVNNFGITVFTGMDDGTAGYSHHSPWNQNYLSGIFEDPAKASNPHGTNGVNYYTHSDSGDISFTALAGQVYSIYLGGNIVGGANFGDVENYKLSITASPVPVPASLWLMGSGLIGLGSTIRKKRAG